MVAKNVSKHINVVLGGQGGDEIFGGYSRYLIAYFEQCIKGAIDGTLDNGNFIVTYNSIIKNLNSLKGYKPLIKEFFSEGLFDSHDKRYLRLISKSNNFQSFILKDVIKNEEMLTNFNDVYSAENVSKVSLFDSMTHFDFKTLLPALLHVEDRMSMAHGIESRVPFLDHHLVEFISTIPADIKFKNGELKRLLKTTYASLIPNSIKNRKDKMGFPVPLNKWFKKGVIATDFIKDTLGSKKAKSRFYFEKGFDVDKIFEKDGQYGRNLWAILSLELWQNNFIDK